MLVKLSVFENYWPPLGFQLHLLRKLCSCYNFYHLVSFCYVTLSAYDFKFWVAKTFQKSLRQLVAFANCLVTFQPCHIHFGKQLPAPPPRRPFTQGNVFCQSLVPVETASEKERSYKSKISHF